MKNYLVCGWLNSEDYDNGKAATQCLPIQAKNESEAEDKAARKFREKYGSMDVIEANEVD
jgi:hypothetical protein